MRGVDRLGTRATVGRRVIRLCLAGRELGRERCSRDLLRQSPHWYVSSTRGIQFGRGGRRLVAGRRRRVRLLPALSTSHVNHSSFSYVALCCHGGNALTITSGIRAPLPSRRMQLQEGGGAAAIAAGADYRTPTLPPALCDFSRKRRTTSDDGAPRVALDTLLGPPYDLLCDAPFEVARQTANENKRLLIVNLQDDSEFARCV